jgi:hypothetical protein
MAQPHFNDQLLKTLSTGGKSGGVSLVPIHDNDLILSPTQRYGSLP